MKVDNEKCDKLQERFKVLWKLKLDQDAAGGQ